MNNKAIGEYIQLLRKRKNLSQKELSEKLNVSFQAVSKWENGENLPDASILLELANILETTTDRILSGGNVLNRRNKRVHMDDLQEGVQAFEDIRTFFGERSMLYIGAKEGIHRRLNIDLDDCLHDEKGKEVLLSEAVIQCLENGYTMDPHDIELCFSSETIRKKIREVLFGCSLFGGKSENYSAYRLSYPSEIKDLIFSMCSYPIIADIGSGTGKFSQLFAEQAKMLYAIEPNEEMRRIAVSLLGKYSNYVSIAATADQTTLDDGSIDIITSAEAYHWFDNEATKTEWKRILKENGYVFLIWNQFGGDPFDEEMRIISEQYREKTKIKQSGVSREQRAIHLFGEGNYQKVEFDNSVLQNWENFCGGWSSASYIPKQGTGAYCKFLGQAKTLFDKYAVNGLLKTTVTTICFFGKLK